MPLSFVSPRRVVALAALAVSAAAAGCSLGGDSTLPEPTDPATQSYAAATGVTLASMTRVNAQLYQQDLVVGTGRTLAIGDSMTVYYNGRLSGGFTFDSRARPATAAAILFDTSKVVNGVATPGLIGGWIQGLAGMKVGGSRKLVIGPSLGYGFNTIRDNNNNLLIPANSVLVFDIEVVTATANQ